MQCRIFRFVLLSFCFFFSGVVLFFASLFWSLTPLFFCELTGNSCKLIVCCSNCYNFWQETNAMQNLQVGVAFLFCFFVCCDFVSLRFAFLIFQPFYSLLPFTFTDRACQFYCQFYWYLTNHCLAFALNIHSILPALKMRRRPSRGIPSLNSQSYHRITLTSCRPAPGTALERASLTSRRILAPGHSALQQMQHTPSHLQLLNLQHHAHADEAPAPCTLHPKHLLHPTHLQLHLHHLHRNYLHLKHMYPNHLHRKHHYHLHPLFTRSSSIRGTNSWPNKCNAPEEAFE